MSDQSLTLPFRLLRNSATTERARKLFDIVLDVGGDVSPASARHLASEFLAWRRLGEVTEAETEAILAVAERLG